MILLDIRRFYGFLALTFAEQCAFNYSTEILKYLSFILLITVHIAVHLTPNTIKLSYSACHKISSYPEHKYYHIAANLDVVGTS
jgi:hypothetical protein